MNNNILSTISRRKYLIIYLLQSLLVTMCTDQRPMTRAAREPETIKLELCTMAMQLAWQQLLQLQLRQHQ